MDLAQDGSSQLNVWYGEHTRQQQAEHALQQQEAGRPQASSALRRGSSRVYRGVSGDKCRYEAHIWAQRKQIFLGCYYNEELAARAYDLAAVALRGPAACTNFPLQQYAAELTAVPQRIEVLVQALREQAKSLGRPASPAPTLQLWEVPLSEAVSGQVSLGLFPSEEEAARAVDRTLLARDGLAAAHLLNFPLANYSYLLGPDQVEQAVRAGLMPAPAVAEQLPPAPNKLYGQLSPFATAATAPPCEPAEAKQADSMAPAAPLPLPRRASVTPRHAGEPAPTPFSFFA